MIKRSLIYFPAPPTGKSSSWNAGAGFCTEYVRARENLKSCKLLEKKTRMMLHVKILSIQYPERYVIRRSVTSAYEEFSVERPDLKMEITEISDAALICNYAQVLLQPTLVINEKVVCSGPFPTKDEIIEWMREAVAS